MKLTVIIHNFIEESFPPTIFRSIDCLSLIVKICMFSNSPRTLSDVAVPAFTTVKVPKFKPGSMFVTLKTTSTESKFLEHHQRLPQLVDQNQYQELQ